VGHPLVPLRERVEEVGLVVGTEVMGWLRLWMMLRKAAKIKWHNPIR
jgi:hypothetical protein